MRGAFLLLLIAIATSGCTAFHVAMLDESGQPPFASRYYGSDNRWHYFEVDLVRASLFPMPHSYYVDRFRLSRSSVVVVPEMQRVRTHSRSLAAGQFKVLPTVSRGE